jgi:ribosomal protein S17E
MLSRCRVIIEKYYQRLTLDFDTNKRICEEVAIIQSKRLRNKIAGFTTVSGSRVGRSHNERRVLRRRQSHDGSKVGNQVSHCDC